MASKGVGVTVTGLPELKRALRSADSDRKAEFKTEQKDASRKVAILTRTALPNNTGKTINKVSARQASTAINAEWAGWLSFGGKRPRDKVARPFIPEGRFLFPQAKQVAPEFEAAVDRMLDKVHRKADLT